MGVVKYSGPVASFHCPTESTIRSLKVHFSPKQLGSGTPSPENVREIVGWDGNEIHASGKNLFPDSLNDYRAWSNKLPDDISFSHGTYSGTVEQGARDAGVLLCDYCFKAGTYTLSFDFKGTTFEENQNMWRPINIVPYTYSDRGWYEDKVSIPYVITKNQKEGHCTKTFTIDYDFKLSVNLHSFGSNSVEGVYTISNIQLELGSTATEYEPYHGSTTNYEFGVLGKNKLDYSAVTTDHYIDGNGVIQSDQNFVYSSPMYLSSTTYTFSGTNDYNDFGSTNVRIHGYAADNSWIKQIINQTTALHGTYSLTFTVPEDVAYIRISMPKMDDAQLELGSTATAYEPYDPNKTVYGGWVDLVSGEVAETYKYKDLSGSSNWFQNGSNIFYQSSINDRKKSSKTNFYCNILPVGIPTTENTAYIQFMSKSTGGLGIIVNNSSTTLTDIQTLADDNQIIIYYELNTPITYHLAPTSMQTFLAQNNIWSNADYVEVEYDLHETQNILARKQFIVANQPHVEKLAAAPLQNFVTDMAAPLKECKVHFEPKQNLNGYDKPWIGGTGKNLFNAVTSSPKLYVESGAGELRFSDDWSASDYIKVDAETTYALTGPNANGSNTARMGFYDADKVFISSIGAYDVQAAGNIFITPANTVYTRISVRTETPTTVQLEKGSVATAYEPWENVCPISGWDSIQIGLPNEYQRVEWIKNPASTTAHIDTGILVTDNMRFEIDFQYDDAITVRHYFMGQWSDTTFFLYCANSDPIVFQTAFGTSWSNTAMNVDTDRHKFSYQIVDGSLHVVADNITEILSKPYESATDQTIKIAGTVQSAAASCKTYGSKIWKNGVMVQELIPCVRKSDNKPGMYDTITQTFFINQGTGEFIYSPDIEEQSLLVDWTDSVGTIHGGYLDLVKGEVVEEWHKIIADGVNIKCNSSYMTDDTIAAGIVYLNPIGKNSPFSQVDINVFMDTIPIYTSNYEGNHLGTIELPYATCTCAGNQYIVFRLTNRADHPEVTDANTCKEFVNNWLQEHPTTIVYELRTPIVHTLTPTQLKTLHGTNNIWSNANGPIELSYWKH